MQERVDVALGYAAIVYVIGDPEIEPLLLVRRTDMPYVVKFPGVAVNVKDVPWTAETGVVSVAVVLTEKSENADTVVPWTVIVHVIFTPRCTTGVVQVRVDVLEG